MKLAANEMLKYLSLALPSVMLDRVDDLVPGHSGSAVKNVSANDASAVGSSPEGPLFGEMQLLEAMRQLAGLVVGVDEGAERAVRTRLLRIESAILARAARCGDRISLSCQATAQEGGNFRCECQAEVDGETVAECVLALSREAA